MAFGLSVDVCSIDEQHRALADTVNGLFADHAPSREEALATIDVLLAAVGEHFAHEEQVMRNIGLPEYAAHKALHQHLLEELRQFRHDIEGRLEQRSAEELRSYLTYWLFRHIAKDDMCIRQHLHR